MGEIVEMVKAVGQGGSLAVAVFLAYLLYRLERAVGRGQEKTEAAITRIHERIDETEKKFVSREEHEEHVRRIAAIEWDYHSKEDFYRDMGGWREEIRELRDEIRSFNGRLDKIILEVKQ